MIKGIEFSHTTVLSYLDAHIGACTDDLSLYRLRELRRSIFKKLEPSNDDSARLELAAFAAFKAQNHLVSQILIDSSTQLHRYLKAELAVLFADPFSLSDCVQVGYCGPGSSIGLKDTDFFHKMFDSPLTHTRPVLYKVYKQAISSSWYLADSLRDLHHSTKIVPGSRLCSVPKDDSKRRVICTEPTLNMFYQLGAKEIIECRLRDIHNLDVRKQQPINRSMARSGSKSSRFVTLDLKDASDRISLELCRSSLPKWLFDLLCTIRSENCNIGGEDVRLNMMSTMGNGTTFPLMTSIISCIVRSVYNMNNIVPKNGVNYAVFGDDIIVVSALCQQVIDSLTELGLIVNVDKSFTTGHFRESCGGDYLHGHSVRGVYIKRLNHEADFYSSYNRLLRWSCMFGIDISDILSLFLDQVVFRPVPAFASESSGILCPDPYIAYLERDGNNAIKYQSLEPKPRKRRVTKKYTNYEGCVISFIGGYISNSCITSRQKQRCYKIQKKTTPNWHWIDPKVEMFSTGWFNNQEHFWFTARALALSVARRLDSLIK